MLGVGVLHMKAHNSFYCMSNMKKVRDENSRLCLTTAVIFVGLDSRTEARLQAIRLS